MKRAYDPHRPRCPEPDNAAERIEDAAREAFGFEMPRDPDPTMDWKLALLALLITAALCGLILYVLDAALNTGVPV